MNRRIPPKHDASCTKKLGSFDTDNCERCRKLERCRRSGT